jgi:hypothetical protein
MANGYVADASSFRAPRSLSDSLDSAGSGHGEGEVRGPASGESPRGCGRYGYDVACAASDLGIAHERRPGVPASRDDLKGVVCPSDSRRAK